MNVRNEQDSIDIAAGWRMRLSESPRQHAAELAAWLGEDVHHRDAWQAVQGPWQLLGEHAATAEVLRLRRTALMHAYNAERRRSAARASTRRSALHAAAAALVVAFGALLLWQLSRPETYRTATGERRVVMLSDGSQISLDSNSEVTVRYSAQARALTLVRGQARFNVAHNAARPFTVSAAGHRVVATGTAFDVDLLGPELLVTLIEGRVIVLSKDVAGSVAGASPVAPVLPVLPAMPIGRGAARVSRHKAMEVRAAAAAVAGNDGDWSRVALDPGEQLVMTSGAVPQIAEVDVNRVTSWERGEVEFNDEPLSSVIERMNRYGTRRMVIGDDRTANLRISGVFHEGDSEAFAATLASYLPIERQQGENGTLLLTYRAPQGRP